MSAQLKQLDARLYQVGKNIPSILKMKPMEASVADAPQLTMSRLFTDHVFLE